MHRRKYYLLLFLLSLPFIRMLFKGSWSSFQSSWAADAYPYLVLFAALAEIYFSKPNLVRFGMIAMGIFLLGLLLHTAHWPGERVFLVTGVALMMLIPLWSALTARHERTLRMIISVWILIYGCGMLMRMLGVQSGAFVIIASMIFHWAVIAALGISLWNTKATTA
jgi:hypothetical protein